LSNSLERLSSTSPLVRTGGRYTPLISRRAGRALAGLTERTLIRVVDVQSEADVAIEKAKGIDQVARESMTGQAMLRRFSDVLSSGDPFIADELKTFTDLARLGKAEVVADLVDAYCREGRR
jgi:hypothetical protein